MAKESKGGSGKLSWSRLLVALAIGLAGSIGIWMATPYNNLLLSNTYMSETSMPLGALAFILLLVVLINPLLGLLNRKIQLNFRQMAIVFGILLVASAPAYTGFMRSLPYSLIGTARDAKDWKTTAEVYEKCDLPPSLFVGNMKFQEEIPAVRYFLHRVPEDEKIPWGAWKGPAISWGTLILFMWTMMMGMAAAVYPQWRRNERLAFPLVSVQAAIIEKEKETDLFPAIFRSHGFWAGLLLVFGIYLLYGLKLYFPNDFPAVPIEWDLKPMFMEEPLLHLPWFVYSGRMFFAVLGVAYFMSNRVGVSLWFFPLAYGIWTVIMKSYAPTAYNADMSNDHITGAMIVLAASIIWLGRLHWKRIAVSMVSPLKTEEDYRDRLAGWMLVVGICGTFIWLLWAGSQPFWALVMVAVLFVYALLATRLTAETGIVLMGFEPLHPQLTLRLLPVRWFKNATLWLYGMMTNFAYHTSETSPVVMGTHAMGLAKDDPPKSTSNKALLFIFVLMGAVLLGGYAHLKANYENIRPLAKRAQRETLGQRFWDCNYGVNFVKEAEAGTFNKPTYSRGSHIGFGFGLAALLQWLCTTFPKWPIHPVGLLILSGHGWWARQCWASVLFGWSLKNVILFCGGARMYNKGKPVFIGLIVGEFLAAIFWAIVSIVCVSVGNMDYEVVNVLPW